MKQEVDLPRAWNDIVFENRHKDYGAYRIRRMYSRNLLAAVFITAVIAGLVLYFPAFMKLIKPEEEFEGGILELKSVTINLDQPPPIVPNEAPPPKIDVPMPVKTIIKFLPPKVTDKEVSEHEEQMPTVEEIKLNQTGPVAVEGTGVSTNVVFEEPVEVKEPKEEEVHKDEVFLIVEQSPEFPGGLQALYKFVADNIRYPAQASRLGIQGLVYVTFIVDQEGQVQNASILKGIGAGCDEEAIRIVQSMPPWKPGKQRGRPVKVKYTLPIKFTLRQR